MTSGFHTTRYHIGSALSQLESHYREANIENDRRNYVPFGIIDSISDQDSSTLITGNLLAVRQLCIRMIHRLAVNNAEKTCVLVPEGAGGDFIISLLCADLCVDFSKPNGTWVHSDYLDLLQKKLKTINELDLLIIECQSLSNGLAAMPDDDFKYLFLIGFPYHDPVSELKLLNHYSSALTNNFPKVIANSGQSAVNYENLSEYIQSSFHLEEIQGLEYQLTIAVRDGNLRNSPMETIEKSVVMLNSSRMWVDYIDKKLPVEN